MKAPRTLRQRTFTQKRNQFHRFHNFMEQQRHFVHDCMEMYTHAHETLHLEDLMTAPRESRPRTASDARESIVGWPPKRHTEIEVLFGTQLSQSFREI